MSTRDITQAYIDALRDAVVRPIVFVRLAFDGNVQRYHTEIGPITATSPTYGSEEYLGLGDFGGITGSIKESVSNAPQAVRVALSGLNSTLLTEALDEDYHRRDAEIMLGLDDTSGDLIGDPVVLYSGYMDKPDITLENGKSDLILTLESKATLEQESPDGRFTDEDLQAEFSGDVGGEYIFRMLDLQLIWGGENSSRVNSVPGFLPVSF